MHTFDFGVKAKALGYSGTGFAYYACIFGEAKKFSERKGLMS